MKTIKNLKAEEIRKSILQLAIQGKLVKQDPNDEPASELVKRIYAEKQKLIKEGKIKKDKNESFIFKGEDNCYYEKIGKNDPVKLEDLPFDIPDSWTWIRLKNISNLNGGYAFKSEKFSNEGIRVIRISDFDEKGIKNKDIKRYPYSTDLDSYRIMVNDILLCMTGGTVGKSAYIKVLDEDCYINQRVALIRVNIINIIYFYSVLTSSYIFSVINTSKTSTNDNISMKLIEDFLIPIPPLNEQERIVGKIKSFEPLIAKYSFVEEELSNLESEFPKKLKKSILQYAIEGKLVKQDPNDEPASVLLERIKAEKEKLIKEGKIKRDKNESYINQGDDKNYYEKICLQWPSNWVALPLKSVLIPMQSCKPQGEYFRYIDIDAVDNKNQVISNPKIMRTKNAPSRASRKLHTGDVIFSIVRPYLKNIALISENYSDCIGSTGFYVCSPLSELNSSFLYYFLLSPYCIDGIMPFMKGDNSPSIRGEDLEKLIIGLPSNNEQDKIIQKLESIIALI